MTLFFGGGGYTWSETEGLGKFTRCKLGAEAYYPSSKMMMIATDFEQTNNHPRGLCCTMVRGGHGSVGSRSITLKPPPSAPAENRIAPCLPCCDTAWSRPCRVCARSTEELLRQYGVGFNRNIQVHVSIDLTSQRKPEQGKYFDLPFPASSSPVRRLEFGHGAVVRSVRTKEERCHG